MSRGGGFTPIQTNNQVPLASQRAGAPQIQPVPIRAFSRGGRGRNVSVNAGGGVAPILGFLNANRDRELADQHFQDQMAAREREFSTIMDDRRAARDHAMNIEFGRQISDRFASILKNDIDNQQVAAQSIMSQIAANMAREDFLVDQELEVAQALDAVNVRAQNALDATLMALAGNATMESQGEAAHEVVKQGIHALFLNMFGDEKQANDAARLLAMGPGVEHGYRRSFNKARGFKKDDPGKMTQEELEALNSEVVEEALANGMVPEKGRAFLKQKISTAQAMRSGGPATDIGMDEKTGLPIHAGTKMMMARANNAVKLIKKEPLEGNNLESAKVLIRDDFVEIESMRKGMEKKAQEFYDATFDDFRAEGTDFSALKFTHDKDPSGMTRAVQDMRQILLEGNTNGVRDRYLTTIRSRGAGSDTANQTVDSDQLDSYLDYIHLTMLSGFASFQLGDNGQRLTRIGLPLNKVRQSDADPNSSRAGQQRFSELRGSMEAAIPGKAREYMEHYLGKRYQDMARVGHQGFANSSEVPGVLETCTRDYVRGFFGNNEEVQRQVMQEVERGASPANAMARVILAPRLFGLASAAPDPQMRQYLLNTLGTREKELATFVASMSDHRLSQFQGEADSILNIPDKERRQQLAGDLSGRMAKHLLNEYGEMAFSPEYFERAKVVTSDGISSEEEQQFISLANMQPALLIQPKMQEMLANRFDPFQYARQSQQKIRDNLNGEIQRLRSAREGLQTSAQQMAQEGFKPVEIDLEEALAAIPEDQQAGPRAVMEITLAGYNRVRDQLRRQFEQQQAGIVGGMPPGAQPPAPGIMDGQGQAGAGGPQEGPPAPSGALPALQPTPTPSGPTQGQQNLRSTLQGIQGGPAPIPSAAPAAVPGQQP